MHKFCLTIILTILCHSFSAASPEVPLETGDPAPEFELQGSDGATYTLSQFNNKKPVIIAFFPKAFTGG